MDFAAGFWGCFLTDLAPDFRADLEPGLGADNPDFSITEDSSDLMVKKTELTGSGDASASQCAKS